jgi:hypothetical protein
MKEITQENAGETSKKRRLRSGHILSLAELREDSSMLSQLLAKYQCDDYHIQLRTGASILLESAWLKRQIHTVDILDVLWDEWNKGKTL